MNKKHFAHLGQTSRRASNPHLQGENLRVFLRFDCQRQQNDAYKLSTKRFGSVLFTTCVEKVADLLVTYADSPSSIFIGYHILLPGIYSRFRVELISIHIGLIETYDQLAPAWSKQNMYSITMSIIHWLKILIRICSNKTYDLLVPAWSKQDVCPITIDRYLLAKGRCGI